MKILSATGGLAGTNCFLVADEAAKVAVLIDAPDHTVGPLLEQAKEAGWDVQALWMTHGHWDHLADHSEVSAAFPGAAKLIHKLDEAKLNSPGSAIFKLPFTLPPGKATGYLADGDELAVGSLRARVMFTPGHCPGHVCFYFQEQKVLVGGDLIIGGAVGRTDLPGCSVTDLMESVKAVMKLPDDTTLLPGHGEVSTVGDERANNAYVRRILAGRSI
jgi:glyoxylase-like metal-dependent hydrolase (beta-lactamase superfamily II)